MHRAFQFAASAIGFLATFSFSAGMASATGEEVRSLVSDEEVSLVSDWAISTTLGGKRNGDVQRVGGGVARVGA